jgi:hypothetical protein
MNDKVEVHWTIIAGGLSFLRERFYRYSPDHMGNDVLRLMAYRRTRVCHGKRVASMNERLKVHWTISAGRVPSERGGFQKIPDTWVTLFRLMAYRRRVYAMEREWTHERKAEVHWTIIAGREDGGTVPGIWYLPEDRL